MYPHALGDSQLKDFAVKEIVMWLLALFGIGVGVYQVDKVNKEHSQKQAEELKKSMGSTNTDCVLMPDSPACSGKK